jgi:NAD-dependent dihydropyrimidine dehydrogenase PreA subunit
MAIIITDECINCGACNQSAQTQQYMKEQTIGDIKMELN